MTVVINGTTGITSVNGTAGAPSVTGADTDTGIVYGTNTLSLATGGTTAVTVDSSQNVGIGTSPSAWTTFAPVLQIKTGSGAGALTGTSVDNFRMFANTYYDGAYKRVGAGYATQYEQASGTHVWYTAGTSTANSTITFAESMRIDSSGNLLVGGTTNGGARFLAQRSDSAVVGRFYATASSSYTSDVLQAISAQGSNTSSTIFGAYYSDGAAFAFRVRGDGTIYAQNTTVQSASDARFKENIVDATDGLAVVNSLRPVRFDIKEGHGVSAKTNQLGFIAQEVQAVFPDAVDVWKESDDPENPYLSLGSTALIPVLVKAIQEQQAIIEQLRADVEALKAAT